MVPIALEKLSSDSVGAKVGCGGTSGRGRPAPNRVPSLRSERDGGGWTDVQRDSLDILRVGAPVYGATAILPYLGDLRDAFVSEVRELWCRSGFSGTGIHALAPSFFEPGRPGRAPCPFPPADRSLMPLPKPPRPEPLRRWSGESDGDRRSLSRIHARPLLTGTAAQTVGMPDRPVRSICRVLATLPTRPGERTALEALIGPVVTACEVHLREPELRLARTCARVLEALAGAAGVCLAPCMCRT